MELNFDSETLKVNDANGNPNQATWTASDRQYSIALPANVWSAPPGGSLNFTVAQTVTSGVYTLKFDLTGFASLSRQDIRVNVAVVSYGSTPAVRSTSCHPVDRFCSFQVL